MTEIPTPRTAGETAYNFRHEAERVCQAIDSRVGRMTVECALREAYNAGSSAIEQELLTALKTTEQKMREWSALLDNFAGHAGLAFKAQQVATELRVSAKQLADIAHAEARK